MLRRWLVAAVVALAIPIAGLLVASFSEGQMERDWLAAVEAQFGDVPANEESQVSLRTLCADPQAAAELGDACNDTRIFGILNALVVGALALSAVLFVVSAGIVLASRGNRSRMAALFRPGLIFLLIGLSLLILVEGVIIVGVLWELMLLIGRVYPFVIAGIAIAVLVGVAGVVRALVVMARRSVVPAAGVALRRDDHPVVFAEVEDVAGLLGTEPPEVILGGLEPSFFVVDADVQGLVERYRGRILYLSVPMCRVYSRAELRAVVGHELGHFRGQDTRYSKAFNPVYVGGSESLRSLTAATSNWRGIAMLPATKLLTAFFLSFAESERTIGRTRELEADQAGAEASSPEALATALLKLESTAAAWDGVFDEAIASTRAGRHLPNIAEDFERRAHAPAPAGSDEEARTLPHPFDTHPPTDLRLEALGLDRERLAEAAADIDPADPATALFGDREALEVALSQHLETFLADRVPRGAETESEMVAGEAGGEVAPKATEAPAGAEGEVGAEAEAGAVAPEATEAPAGAEASAAAGDRPA